jgi:hypothetical protein
VDGGYVEDCVSTAPRQHTHANPSRFRHEVKKKNRDAVCGTSTGAVVGCARTAFTSKISLHPLHPHDHETVMGKKELLEARRGARTHNLEIKSLTRYRLCQPGLLLLIDEREGSRSCHITRHGIFRTGSGDDRRSFNNFIVRCIENDVERFGMFWMRSGERRPEALVQPEFGTYRPCAV